MNQLFDRMIRAAKLDVALYEEVEHDTSAMGQAVLVVIIASVAAGIGNINYGLTALSANTILSLVGWFIWSYLVFIIGAKAMPEPNTQADYGQLLRTIGFSSAPGILQVIGIINALGPLVSLVAGIWMLIAMVVAVRQALDYSSTGRAVVVCLLGFVAYLLIATLIGGLFLAAA